MNTLQTRVSNKKGIIALACGVASIFFYPFLMLQVLAIGFGCIALKEAKNNPTLPRWQAYVGITLGGIYLFMFVMSILGLV